MALTAARSLLAIKRPSRSRPHRGVPVGDLGGEQEQQRRAPFRRPRRARGTPAPSPPRCGRCAAPAGTPGSSGDRRRPDRSAAAPAGRTGSADPRAAPPARPGRARRRGSARRRRAAPFGLGPADLGGRGLALRLRGLAGVHAMGDRLQPPAGSRSRASPGSGCAGRRRRCSCRARSGPRQPAAVVVEHAHCGQQHRVLDQRSQVVAAAHGRDQAVGLPALPSVWNQRVTNSSCSGSGNGSSGARARPRRASPASSRP